jgi:hypothetical protein
VIGRKDMMRKASPDTDQISRSILQKAVRRGDYEMTKKVIACIIQNNDFDWMRKRLAVMTFEECWTYGYEVAYDNDQEIITKHYLKLVGTAKNRNAAGLGSLAYVLSEKDESVLQGDVGDNAIKIITEAIKCPKEFWEWAHKQNLNEKQKKIVEMADKGFRKAGWPWDRAFALSAAYLAITDEIPEIKYLEIKSDPNFPLWVGIDKHTKEGKIAIRKAAKQIGFDANKALWLAFYFESATCNIIENSPWWEREISWRMKKLELTIEKGKEIWEQLKPLVKENLKDEVTKIEEKLTTVKQIRFTQKQPIQTTLF